MSDAVYSVTEVVGTSKTSIEDAINGAVSTAARKIKNLDWFEVQEVRGHIEGHEVAHYQVVLKIGFRYEEQ